MERSPSSSAARRPESSPRRSATVRLNRRQWTLAAHWVLMFVGTHWPEIGRYKPDQGWPIPFFSEAVHLSLYGIWGALWWWVLTRRPGGATAAVLWWVVVGGFCYGCFDEMTQLLVGRSGKFYDVMVDTVGVTLGIWLPWVLGRARSGGNRKRTG